MTFVQRRQLGLLVVVVVVLASVATTYAAAVAAAFLVVPRLPSLSRMNPPPQYSRSLRPTTVSDDHYHYYFGRRVEFVLSQQGQRGRPSTTCGKTALCAAANKPQGVGMGMAKNKNGNNGKQKKKNKGKKKKKESNTSTGLPSSLDVNASLLRLEKKYDELMISYAKRLYDDNDNDEHNTITTEYVVATRARRKRGNNGNNNVGHDYYLHDWVPIAQLCVVVANHHKSNSDDPILLLLRSIVSQYRRELHHVATMGSMWFQNVPRQFLEYSIEPYDSFHRYVYEPVMEQQSTHDDGGDDDDGHAHQSTAGPSSSSDKSSSSAGTLLQSSRRMSKQTARRVLGLVPDNDDDDDDEGIRKKKNGRSSSTVEDDMTLVRQKYRQMAFACHPDRFAAATSGDNNQQTILTDEADRLRRQAAASDQFATIRLAYETLSSGIKNSSKNGTTSSSSWYESLGGRARTDFWKIELLPLVSSKQQKQQRGEDDDVLQLYQAVDVETALVGLGPDLVQTFVARSRQ